MVVKYFLSVVARVQKKKKKKDGNGIQTTQYILGLCMWQQKSPQLRRLLLPYL